MGRQAGPAAARSPRGASSARAAGGWALRSRCCAAVTLPVEDPVCSAASSTEAALGVTKAAVVTPAVSVAPTPVLPEPLELELDGLDVPAAWAARSAVSRDWADARVDRIWSTFDCSEVASRL